MATDYISPWGGMPTGTNPLYGYSSVPQSVLDHFANYMSSGGMNIAYQDPNGLYWQAENGLGNGEMNGSGVTGYRVYQPSWDGGFDVGSGYDLFQGDGSYGGSEGFLKPSAQRTFNLGLGAVATLGGLSQLGALGGAADAAGSTAATGAGEAAAGTGAVSSPVVGGGAGAVTATDLGALGAGGAGAAGAGGAAAGGGLLSSLGGLGGIAKVAAPLVGGLLGSQEQQTGGDTTRQLPGFLQQPVTGDLVPRVQGLLNEQRPEAHQAGNDMMARGSQMLNNTPMVGNGFTNGAVTLNAPTTATNPYLSSMADDMGRRTQELLAQNNNQIAGRQISAGGMGSTRMGVAQGTAAGQAADSLQGQLANLYGQAYNADQGRALQQYGMDQGFFNTQRGQDLAQIGVGSGLMSQGLQTQWAPIQSAAQAYQPFTGFGTTSQSQGSGGGWQGALGGALGAAQLGKNFGWW